MIGIAPFVSGRFVLVVGGVLSTEDVIVSNV